MKKVLALVAFVAMVAVSSLQQEEVTPVNDADKVVYVTADSGIVRLYKNAKSRIWAALNFNTPTKWA